MFERTTADRTPPSAGLSVLWLSVVAALFSLAILPPASALAQRTIPDGVVQFNLQGEVALERLIDYVSARLGVRFTYKEDLSDRRVTLQAPTEIAVDTLPVLLSSVLRSEGLAITESEVPGFKKIIKVADIVRNAPVGTADQAFALNGPAAPVTAIIRLKHLDVEAAETALKSFVTSDGGKLQKLPSNNSLIITDYASNLRMIENLLKIIDRGSEDVQYHIYRVQHQQSTVLAEQVAAILKPSGASSNTLQILDEPQGNQVLIAGSKAMVDQAMVILRQLDISLKLRTKVYRFTNITAERIDKIVRGYIAPKDADRVYQATVDDEGNLLVVRATDAIHEQIDDVLEELDQPAEAGESPIQFYKLRNANALDVLYSLLSLQEAYGSGVSTQGFGNNVLQTGYTPFGTAQFSPTGTSVIPGLNRVNSPLQQNLSGGIGSQFGNQNQQALATTALPLAPTSGSNSGAFASNNPFGNSANNPLAGLASGGGLGQVATLPGGARVSADVGTNSVIVVAPSNVQPLYEKLINSLDRRRPQVLIEAKIIAVDTTDNFGLGIEVSAGDREGDRRLFKFTSFGLSEVNPDTGALSILPALGFNGAMVDPEVADVVVQAMARHNRATVLAAPKILVNDNSTGKLESVVSVPFQSVNASETVSTTSLGGDQQAGTIITVTPHINENDHLQLEFDVEFSTFNEGTDDTLPPPRQIDRVGSVVTIPDGKTVIVGGLRRTGESHLFEGIPWAEKIPLVRELTSETQEQLTTTSFFLFIRPRVLRDSRFQDLRFLSDRESSQAGLPGDFPVSGPVLIP